ncbi:MAG: Type restriction enzyme protein [Pseudomonadota bacterium]
MAVATSSNMRQLASSHQRPARRSQYRFGGKVNTQTGEMSYGFTSTPIEKTDANTGAVFGDYISI